MKKPPTKIDAVTLIASLEARGIELVLSPDRGEILAWPFEAVTEAEWDWIKANFAGLAILLAPALETPHDRAARYVIDGGGSSALTPEQKANPLYARLLRPLRR